MTYVQYIEFNLISGGKVCLPAGSFAFDSAYHASTEAHAVLTLLDGRQEHNRLLAVKESYDEIVDMLTNRAYIHVTRQWKDEKSQ
jgi:hypothetical protein